jgi:hypothetical protein
LASRGVKASAPGRVRMQLFVSVDLPDDLADGVAAA